MSLYEALDSLKFDKRLLDYNLQHNLITREQYDQFLQQLDDCSPETESVTIVGDEPAPNESENV